MRRLPLRSPPRVRGKVPVCCPEHRKVRITPAYAGKRDLVISGSGDIEDHPRVCGEKLSGCVWQQACAGSPPRMRGKVSQPHYSTGRGGITPAYAGKRSGMLFHKGVVRDHPRVCGEKLRAFSNFGSLPGSPPRMRGKASVFLLVFFGAGITPAYAGKRLKRSHSIGHFSCILCLFHSVLHRASASGGSRAGPCAPPCLPAQNAVPV